ncbi:hypothetical protein GJU40_17535 [Bacillus lacus]|uniref:Uncharacterized protein n=1 Tax=Metabacillus lacus TaxID=1983721 RepID=A0A7X2J1W0_9BACI|nr:hypothetical protein [Metabacillus lacus]MRX73938.1 hypothetical protein [Metabacillus lacus]
MIEVFTVFPDGNYSVSKVPRDRINAVFKKLDTKPEMVIEGIPYMVNHYTGIGTNILTDNDCIKVYLENQQGEVYPYLFYPKGDD